MSSLVRDGQSARGGEGVRDGGGGVRVVFIRNQALLSMLERVEGIRSKIAGIGDQEAVSLSTRCRAFLMRGISSLTVFHITVASTPK